MDLQAHMEPRGPLAATFPIRTQGTAVDSTDSPELGGPSVPGKKGGQEAVPRKGSAGHSELPARSHTQDDADATSPGLGWGSEAALSVGPRDT